MSFGARALIRLGALKHNLSVIKERAPTAKITAVVKANAYGHGLTTVAAALTDVDSYGVARLPEAIELRESGHTKPIILLSGVFTANELSEAAAHDCELVVHTEQQIELLEARSDLRLTVWLKLDTGMHRLGFPVTRAVELIDRLRACSAVAELRLMTHLANADDPRDQKTNSQLATFAAVAENFDGDISIANSGGIFGWPTAVQPPYLAAGASIWIRPGIALYGISPFPDLNGADLGLQPAMQFESRLIAVKDISTGDSVGYGGRWRADKDTTIGIISAGYGDGLTGYLSSGTPVMVNGKIVPLVGAVSMDMAAVDLGSNSDDRSGDPVLIWGEELPVEEIARRAGILAYQLVCGVMHREDSSTSR